MSGLLGHRGLLLQSTVAEGTDPYWNQVTSLLHFNGVNGSTTFTDQKGVAWTRQGNAVIDTSAFKFGDSSLSTGTSGYLQAPSAGLCDFGVGDFTLEAWVRPLVLNQYQNIFNSRDGGSGTVGLSFRLTNAGVLQAFRGSGQNAINGTTVLSASGFQHVALARSGTTWRLFLNGSLEGSAAIATDVNPGGPGFIGAYGAYGATERWQGHIDEFRITKGVARYTAAFTPPTAAFPNG
jgi:hypothetical protein